MDQNGIFKFSTKKLPMIFNFSYIVKTFAEIRFCVLPNNVQGVKLNEQLIKYDKIMSSYFHFSTSDVLNSIAGHDVYMLLDGKNLAGYVQYQRSKAYSLKNRKEFDFFTLYCFTVTNQYSGKGLSYRLLEDSINDLKKRYSLSDNSIIALHLSPNDLKMPIASKIYYSYGFRKGMFIKSDPKEMCHRLDELFKKSTDILDIVTNKKVGNGEGYYFLLFCHLKDLQNHRKTSNFQLKHGEILFEILKKRKANIKILDR